MDELQAYLSAWAIWEGDALQALPVGWWVWFGIFCVCWAASLWFLFARVGKLAFYSPVTHEQRSALPPVSIVVACRNDGQPLADLLPRLKSQRYPDFEIIIVDDRSDDALYDNLLIASRRADAGFKLVRVNYTPEHVNAKKFAVTLGIKAAQYPIVLLTDADCVPATDHWLAEMAAPFAHGDTDVVLGYSPYQRARGALNTLIRFDAFYTAVQYIGATLAGQAYMGVGRNLAYKRSFFFDAKGFGAAGGVMGGDDDLLINRAATPGKVALSINPQAHVVSIPKTTFAAWARQKWRHLSVSKHYKLADKLALGMRALLHGGYYLSFVVCLFAVPLTFMVIPLFVIRCVLHLVWMAKASKKLGDTFPAWQWPLLDAWLPIHYFIFGLPGLLSKRIAWN